jgi:hypothetical protein
VAVRAAARAEQVVRAHPALQGAFYAVVTRSSAARCLLGLVKSRVRQSAVPAARPLASAEEDPAVRTRRDASVAARLRLPAPGPRP